MQRSDGPARRAAAPPSDTSSSARSEPRSDDDRLESWKEIAAHFRCSVRAVQNWEKHEGLPVHRHRHKKLGTVYAYRSELDAWRRLREPASAKPDTPRPGARRTVAAGLTMSALVVTGIVIFGSSSEPPSFELGSPRHVTSGASLDDFPSWSPDGKLLAYHSSAGGSDDIWTLDVESGKTRNRTADSPEHDRFPSWSPDGSRIAFHSERGGGGYFVVSLDDGSVARVGDAPFADPRTFHGVPQWSPDGSKLAWIGMDASLPKPWIEIREVDGDSVRRIDLPGKTLGRFDLAWSPDGRWFAYVDAHDTASDVASIWILDPFDERAHAVVERRRNDRRPSWSADRTELFFLSEHGGSTDLWRQPLDGRGRPGGDPVALTAGVDVRHAAVPPDATRLAYSRGRETANLWRFPVLDGRAAGWDDAEALTFDDAFAEQPDLSPDRKEVAFVTDRRGGPRIWIVGVEDGRLRPFSDEAHKAWAPRWSPDGSAIAFYSYRSGNRDVWVRPVEGGEARQITSHSAEDIYPAWSPDGARLAFASDRAGSWDIWVISAEGGEPTRLTTDPATDTLPQWSPGGGWISFGSSRQGTRLWKIPASGGPAVPSGVERSAAVSQWRPDGTIYFHGRYESDGRIWAFDPNAGSTRAVTSLKGRRGALWEETFTVRDRQLVVSWKEETSHLWLMDVRRGSR